MIPDTIQSLIKEIEAHIPSTTGPTRGLLIRSLISIGTMHDGLQHAANAMVNSLCSYHLDECEVDGNLVVDILTDQICPLCVLSLLEGLVNSCLEDDGQTIEEEGIIGATHLALHLLDDRREYDDQV